MDQQAYFDKEWKRVRNLYSKAKHSPFGDATGLAHWFVAQLKDNDCQCYYCETSIHDINILIDAGLLKERKIGYGFRGRILEIDKNDSTYIKENCVLACYYCNNDKSYITDKIDYKTYFGANRKKYFELLIEKIETVINQKCNEALSKSDAFAPDSKKISLLEIRKLITTSNDSYAEYLENLVTKAERFCNDTNPEFRYSIDSIDFGIFSDGVVIPFGELGYLITDKGMPPGEVRAFPNYPYERVT